MVDWGSWDGGGREVRSGGGWNRSFFDKVKPRTLKSRGSSIGVSNVGMIDRSPRLKDRKWFGTHLYAYAARPACVSVASVRSGTQEVGRTSKRFSRHVCNVSLFVGGYVMSS